MSYRTCLLVITSLSITFADDDEEKTTVVAASLGPLLFLTVVALAVAISQWRKEKRKHSTSTIEAVQAACKLVQKDRLQKFKTLPLIIKPGSLPPGSWLSHMKDFPSFQQGVACFSANYDASKVTGSPKFKVLMKAAERRDEKGLRDFKAILIEAIVLKYASHKNIATLIGLSSTQSRVVMLTEYTGFGTLREILIKNRNLEENIRIVFDDKEYSHHQVHPVHNVQLAEDGSGKNSITVSKEHLLQEIAHGIQYLARKSIVHGAICSHNIAVSRSVTPKIFNFAMAKLLSNSGTKKIKRLPDSLIRFTSVETVSSNLLTFGSDVWSFGMVAYEIYNRAIPYAMYSDGPELKKHIAAGNLPIGLGSDVALFPDTCKGHMFRVLRECFRRIDIRRNMDWICNALASAINADFRDNSLSMDPMRTETSTMFGRRDSGTTFAQALGKSGTPTNYARGDAVIAIGQSGDNNDNTSEISSTNNDDASESSSINLWWDAKSDAVHGSIDAMPQALTGRLGNEGTSHVSLV